MEMTKSELAKAQKLLGELQKILEKPQLDKAKLRKLKQKWERFASKGVAQ